MPYVNFDTYRIFTAALRGFLSQHGFLCLQTAIELSVKK